MKQRRWLTVAVASAAALLTSGGLLTVSAPAAIAGAAVGPAGIGGWLRRWGVAGR
jgi:hypothetical protein